MSRFMVTHTDRDRHGSMGMTKTLGRADSLDEAKALAEAEAPGCETISGALHWRGFSPTTWGLMSGQLYTFVLVTKCAEPRAEAAP